jgi:predicted ArsR family transcriptional regulator
MTDDELREQICDAFHAVLREGGHDTINEFAHDLAERILALVRERGPVMPEKPSAERWRGIVWAFDQHITQPNVCYADIWRDLVRASLSENLRENVREKSGDR